MTFWVIICCVFHFHFNYSHIIFCTAKIWPPGTWSIYFCCCCSDLIRYNNIWRFYLCRKRVKLSPTSTHRVGTHLLLWISRWRCKEKGVRNRALHSSHWKGLSSEWVCGKNRPCVSSCGLANDKADGRRSCILGWLNCCGKAAQRGLKVQSASVFLPLSLPSKPCPTCPSEWHLNPQSKHGGPQGWSRPQTPQIPTSKRLIDHTPPPSSVARCSSNCTKT